MMALSKKLQALWHSETTGLTSAAVIVGLASIASRLVGVLRDRALASTFGAGHELDAYYAAFRVPDLLYTLIILGALSAGFIPVFSEYLETKGKDEAWKLAAQVVSAVGMFMAVACGVLALTAQWLVPLTVPGFSPEQTALTVGLSRIMFLSPLLLGLSAVMGGILQATRRFLAFSLAPVFYNLGIIFGTIFLSPQWGMEGVAWGVVLGALLHLLVQASVVKHLGLGSIPFPSFKPSGVQRILKLMIPRTIGLAVSQMNLVILLIFASAMAAGSVAVFNLANNLQSFPVGVFGISYALAAFPLLSRAASLKDWALFRKELNSAASKIAFLILPSTALFFLLRAQAVRVVLGAGAFDWNDTIRTADVLGIFLFSMLGQAMIPLLARAFYAVQDTRTPLWISVISEIVTLVLAWNFRHTLGVTGLALAFTISTYVNAGLLWCMFRRKNGSLEEKKFFLSFGKTFLASCAIIVAGYPVRQFLGTIFPLETFWQVALQSAGAGIAGGAAFVLVAWLLKEPELNELIHAFRRKLLRNRPKVSGAEEAQGL